MTGYTLEPEGFVKAICEEGRPQGGAGLANDAVVGLFLGRNATIDFVALGVDRQQGGIIGWFGASGFGPCASFWAAPLDIRETSSGSAVCRGNGPTPSWACPR